MPDDQDNKTAPSRLARRLYDAESTLMPRQRDHDEVVLEVIGAFFGEPLPVPFNSDHIPTPVDKARYLISMLDYYARAYERGDEEQRRMAAASIDTYWQTSSVSLPPHVRFTRYVFELAPSTRHAGVHVGVLAERLIAAFGVQHPALAQKLKPELVAEALTCALLDGRKSKTTKTKWQALADAWASTGESKKPGTFKTDWNEENAAHRKRERWLGER